MKAVLISIQPKWCELIASGKKTLEIRKTRPKLETPFKCYIYCTLTGSNEFFRDALKGDVAAWNRRKWGERKGNVIGEFICDDCSLLTKAHYRYIEQFGCVSKEALHAYMGFENGRELSYSDGCWGWHISGMKIYDEQKALSALCFPPERFCEPGLCGRCPKYEIPDEYGDVMFDCEWKRPVMKAPQSWCYVEELVDECSGELIAPTTADLVTERVSCRWSGERCGAEIRR